MNITRRQAIVAAATPFLAPYLLGKANADSGREMPNIDVDMDSWNRRYYGVDKRFFFHRLWVPADRPIDNCHVVTHYAEWDHKPEMLRVPFQFIHNHHKYISNYCKQEGVGGAEYKRIDIYKISHLSFMSKKPRYTPVALLSMSSIDTKPTFSHVRIA